MGANSNSHYVNCFQCGAPYNTMTASWCSCLISERSLVCPACLKCFCKAPAGAKDEFWTKAPRILLERKQEEHQRPLPASVVPSADVRRPMVLVVDDEASIVRLAIRAIRGLGYSAVWCEDGARALEMVRECRPDVVLTDARMPRLDGRDLCRHIKSDPELAAIRVVVMSGVYTQPTDMSEGRRQYGVDDYLAKPIDFKELGLLLQKYASIGSPIPG